MTQAKDPLLEIEERLTEWRKWSNPAKGVHWSEKALNDIQSLLALVRLYEVEIKNLGLVAAYHEEIMDRVIREIKSKIFPPDGDK